MSNIHTALVAAQAEMTPETDAQLVRAMFGQSNARPGRQHSRTPLHVRLATRLRFGSTDCWHWGGPLNGKGYGRMTYQGRMQVVHRLSWMAFKGDIPGGMSVLHTCDNRCCINPDHLWLGTYSDNMKDCWSKGRNPGRTGKKGNNR